MEQTKTGKTLTTDALTELIKERASNKLKKELYDLFVIFSTGLMQPDHFTTEDEFPAEVKALKDKFWVGERFEGGIKYYVTGDLAKSLYDYWLPIYCERETKELLNDVSDFLHYKDHPEEAGE